MKNFKDFHHYKGNSLNRYEKVERKVAQLLMASKIPDSKRESSAIWEFKHAAGCTQIARILAQKRKLDEDLAATASILHDIYVIVSGKYQNHGPNGGPVAQDLLKEIGGFDTKETATIVDAVVHHSEKEIYSSDPYVELVKDVDVFDCSLYKNSEGYYRLHKSPEIVEEYIKRIKRVRKELGLSATPIFR